MERHFRDCGIEFRAGCELNTNEAIKQAVQAGLGLGLVSAQTVELELELRRLVVLPVESFPITRRWYVVHRTHKRLSAAAQQFRALLLAGAGPFGSDGPDDTGEVGPCAGTPVGAHLGHEAPFADV